MILLKCHLQEVMYLIEIAFEAFCEKGIFNSQTALKFKDNILSAGGSEHPSILYKRFRGRDANPDALLRRAGLVAKK